jgi:hypothetical protein
MYRGILVPLDGSALAGAEVNPALERSFSEPSPVSSLVDGLEAEAQTDPNTITAGVQSDGTQTFSLIHESSITEVNLAVADAIKVNTFAMSTPIRADNAGCWEHYRPGCPTHTPSPVLLILPRQ